MPGSTPTVLIDSGANAECTAQWLLQFAQMGGIYMNRVLGVEKPRIGLLNIGAEEEKGNDVYKQAHQLLKGTFQAEQRNAWTER